MLGLLAAAAVPAEAAPITSFTTSTRGCFGLVAGDCTTSDLGTIVALNGVTFTGTTNEVTLTPGGAGVIDLGTFTRPAANNPQGSDLIDEFLLEITFIIPTGVNGSPDEFTALVTANNGSAPITFDFDNTPVPYTFLNLLTTGGFTFTIGDAISLSQNDSVNLTGAITGAQFELVQPIPGVVPEPASLLLLGSGLAALAARRRRARQ